MEQLQAFINDMSTPNIFWLHGHGNNGKTTIINKLLSTVSNSAKISTDLMMGDDIESLPPVVVMNDPCPDADMHLLERLAEKYSQTRFIVESNFAPPTHLECQSLFMTQVY